MTAQLPKKKIIKKQTDDAAFMLRWLNGTLREGELSSLRNKEEYEEMMTMAQNSDRHLSSELRPLNLKNEQKNALSTTSAKPIAFVAFVVVAVLLLALFAFKFNW